MKDENKDTTPSYYNGEEPTPIPPVLLAACGLALLALFTAMVMMATTG